ncbi:MAG: ABC transporter permease [Oligoflexus sp.]|nr:ABC transporter permease [Oligoflexus sp.]
MLNAKFIWVNIQHEVRDFMRDRSTLRSMFSILILLPFLYSYIIAKAGSIGDEAREKDKRIGYIESVKIREMLPFLKQQGLQLVSVKAIEKKVFEDEKLDALISERRKDILDSPDQFSANIELWTASTETKQMASAHHVAKLISGYGQILSQKILILRGVSPQLMRPIDLEMKSLKVDDSSSFATYELLLSLFGMALFFSTLHLAVDTTVGERERMILESLFYTEAPRSSLAIGKWIVVSLMIVFSVWLVGTVFWALGEFSIFQKILGRSQTFSYESMALGFLIFLPLCPMIAAMQILIGSISASVKHAQTFNSIFGFMLLPLSLLSLVEEVKGLAYLPVFGQGLAFRSLLKAEEIDWRGLMVTEGTTILLTAIIIAFVLRRFNQEKIIYSL